MLNIMTKTLVIPSSLLSVKPVEASNYDGKIEPINFGHSGFVFKANLCGKLVAVKILQSAYYNTVSSSY